MAGVLCILVMLVLSLAQAQAQETDRGPVYIPISFASDPALCASGGREKRPPALSGLL